MRPKSQYLFPLGAVLLVGLLYVSALVSSAHSQDSALPPKGEAAEEAGQGELQWERRRRHMREARSGDSKEQRYHRKRGMLRAKAKFLDFSRKYTESVQDPYQAIGFAAIGIKEYYRREGKPAEAVAELQKLLADTKDRRARNVLLFAIRQVYESSNDMNGFMETNRRILEENLAEVEKRN